MTLVEDITFVERNQSPYKALNFTKQFQIVFFLFQVFKMTLFKVREWWEAKRTGESTPSTLGRCLIQFLKKILYSFGLFVQSVGGKV